MGDIIQFLKINPVLNQSGGGYGDGCGNGDGHGDGQGYGNGYGNGHGNGYGCGNGNGYGNGHGNGYGCGNGDGHGDGYGNGDGLVSLNKQNIYVVDDILTIIVSVKNNIAKGFVVQKDLTLTSCYIAKGENQFAHGETIQEALQALQDKLLISKPIKVRIQEFKQKFKSISKKYKALDFYNWHYLLTGSCDLGRKSFCKDNNINLDEDKLTVIDFINLTKESYQSHIILQLEKEYI